MISNYMDIIEQIIAKISQVNSILIIVLGANADSLASGLALKAFLKKLEKDVTLLSPMPVTQKLDFLPGLSDVASSVDLTKSFVIDLSTKKSEVAELSYKKEPNRLSIYLKPKTAEFSAQDVSFRNSDFPYELIIMVGISSFEHLGDFYSNNTSLFFETPMINIDFRASNDNFGQLNLVNLTTTSCSEIVLDLINKFEGSLIDESIATQLLTGIISETNSFQHVRTTPLTFLKASQLVSLGAKQQEIITNLYKSKSLGLLKLWGRVLARLNIDNNLGLAYSVVNQADITKSGASESDAEGIIKELQSQLNFAKTIVFLKEELDPPAGGQTVVYCYCNLGLNLLKIFEGYDVNMIAPQTVKFTVPSSVSESEKKIIELISSEIQKLNL